MGIRQSRKEAIASPHSMEEKSRASSFRVSIHRLTIILMMLFLGACTTPGKLERVTAQLPAHQDHHTHHQIIEVYPIRQVLLADLLFDFEQSVIRPEAKHTLDRAAVFLAQNPTMIAAVNGHTDHSGGTFHNQILSIERARAVKRAIVARGIPRSRIKTDGLGESRPLASNHTMAGRRFNRRVEIVFLKERASAHLRPQLTF